MTYIANPNAVNDFKITGDYRVDALIYNNVSRWNIGSDPGTPVSVNYSFMVAPPSYGGNTSSTDSGFYKFTKEQQAALKIVALEISASSSIQFNLTVDSDNVPLRFGANDQKTSAGYAFDPPDISYNQTSKNYMLSGDVWINNDMDWSQGVVGIGTEAYVTLLHETLHAIGLKHPGNYNAGDVASPIDSTTNILGKLEDNLNYSIMSYIDAPEPIAAGLYEGQVTRYNMGIYDLLALNYLYGRGQPNPGNTIYKIDNSWGSYLRTIDDISGTNTIDLSELTIGAQLNLNQGSFTSVGLYPNNKPASNNLSISFGTLIQNAMGSSGNDVIVNNSLDNTIDGGAGIDYCSFSEKFNECIIIPNGNTYIIKTKTQGIDTLKNIEFLNFSDKSIDLSKFITSNSIINETHALSIIIDKNILGSDAVLLKGLVEKMSMSSGVTLTHTVEYAGAAFDYNAIDSSIITVTRDNEFTSEFTKEINDYLNSNVNITYSQALSIVGVANIDKVLIAVAGADGNYVG